MCGRFTLTRKDLGGIPVDLNLVVPSLFQKDFVPQYNVAPTNAHWIIIQKDDENRLEPALWGFTPSWSEKAATVLINARAETAKDKPTFRRAFREGRCLVPVDGFYEWVGPKSHRRPVRFHLAKNQAFLFAGLFTKDAENPQLQRFTILTTEADDVVKPIHHRMPVILALDEANKWLAPTQNSSQLQVLHELIRRPGRTPLSFDYVSSRVNDPRNNDSELIHSLG